MQVIDPHIHMWDTEQLGIAWLVNPSDTFSGDNRKLSKRFTLDELRIASGDVEVLKVVSIEARADDALQETRWLQSLAEKTGYPQGVVAFADLSSKHFPEALQRQLSFSRLRGIRQILNVHDNPRYDYVGRHYMREATWRSHLDLLADNDVSFDLQIYPSQMEEAAAIARAHPRVSFILNHAGMSVDRSTIAGWHAWRVGLNQLAACENVAVKISGLAMFDHDWTLESLRPYVLETIDAFGINRCMFASNFPIDGLHSSYPALWHAYANLVRGASATECHALFVGNAERIYRL